MDNENKWEFLKRWGYLKIDVLKINFYVMFHRLFANNVLFKLTNNKLQTQYNNDRIPSVINKVEKLSWEKTMYFFCWLWFWMWLCAFACWEILLQIFGLFQLFQESNQQRNLILERNKLLSYTFEWKSIVKMTVLQTLDTCLPFVL